MPDTSLALGAFLRMCRDRTTPSDAGIDAFPGARRVPGLRKEELAFLAGISADHYSRIEQGRLRTLSADVIDALARALRLDETEHAHLRHLAGPVDRRRAASWNLPQRADPGMLRLMTALPEVPVLLLGRHSRILARNALLAAVLGAPLEPDGLFLEWLFAAEARERITNWEDFAAAAVGGLRYELGRHPEDARLVRLITALRERYHEVEQWWGDQRVTDRTSLTKRINHPHAGPLVFGIEAVVGVHDPDQRLVVYTVEPGSPTAAALPLLASWTGDAAVGDR